VCQKVGRVNLRFVDRETGEGREEGATRPEVILRQMSTRPGQVRRAAAVGQHLHHWPQAHVPVRVPSAGERAASHRERVRYRLHITQVYNMKQAQADIESVYSMGLFDDVNILPSPAEDAMPDAPKVARCAVAATPMPSFDLLRKEGAH
jgi:hypothetical protein